MHSRCVGQHLTKALPLSWSADEEGGGGGGRRRRGGGGRGGFEEVGVADKHHKPVRSIECRYLEREVKY